MKIIAVLSIAFFAFGQSLAQSPFNEKDSIEIKGKVIGYSPKQEDHFITFSTYGLSGKAKQQAIQISDDGSFWIKLYQPFIGDVQVNYKDAYLNLYAEPKKPIILTINDAKVSRETGHNNAFSVKGELASTNNDLLKFNTAFTQHQFGVKTDMGDKSQSDSAFAAQVKLRLNEELNFLDLFIKTNQINNKTFINWQRNHLQYTAAKEILFFPFAGKFNKEITQEKLLLLLKGIPLNNELAFQNSSYYSFLSMLNGDQQIIININPLYEVLKKENKGNSIGILLNEIDKYANGLTREFLYTLTYSSKGGGSASDPNQFSNRFDQVITNPFLKQQLFAKQTPNSQTFKAYSVFDRLKALKVKEALKQRLTTIFNKYEGNALYIDFWGDWCGPCMSELPNYPKLIAAMEGKPIKFLFLSTFTTEESMLAIKEKFKINGDFINLNKDEVAIVNNVFEFHSYPSHFLVNDKGNVIENMARVSVDGADKKAQQIEDLLKKSAQ